MKFLVMWELDIAHLRPEMTKAVARMPEHAAKIAAQGNLVARYHVVGKHGGAWIYEAGSNEELELLLASSPVYNYARHKVYPLADMASPYDVLQQNAP